MGLSRMRQALNEVPLGKGNREAVSGRLKDGEGNPDLEGYDCVVRTVDALANLGDLDIIQVDAEPSGKLLDFHAQATLYKLSRMVGFEPILFIVSMEQTRKSAWPGNIAELIASG